MALHWSMPRTGPDGWTVGLNPAGLVGKFGIYDDMITIPLEAAIVMQREWRAVIGRSGGSGRKYTQNGRTWIASAPGEPPVKVTGDAQDSIRILPSVLYGVPAFSVVATDPALMVLEYGILPGAHPKGVTILPRPHVQRAYNRARPKMKNAIVRRLRGTHNFG